jgi:hypothetical protein
MNQENVGLSGKKPTASSAVVEETGRGTAQSSLGDGKPKDVIASDPAL